jgi:hypothetical protein
MSLKNKKKSLSPYARYGKKPYEYSVRYRNWKADIIAGRIQPGEVVFKPAGERVTKS